MLAGKCGNTAPGFAFKMDSQRWALEGKFIFFEQEGILWQDKATGSE